MFTNKTLKSINPRIISASVNGFGSKGEMSDKPAFDFIAQATTNAIMDISVSQKKPVGNGIITCLNMKQAKVRKNKGAEAANAVISILSQK